MPLPEDLEQALERLLVSVLLLSMTLEAVSLVGTVRHYAGEWVPHLTLAAIDLASSTTVLSLDCGRRPTRSPRTRPSSWRPAAYLLGRG
jgi:hypothetical protein